MNIQFQICGLCILFLLIIFYKSHKNLELYKEKVFYSVLYYHGEPDFRYSFTCDDSLQAQSASFFREFYL